MDWWEFFGLTAAALGGLAAYGAMHPAAQLFGATVRRTGRPRAIALTFDDGPNPSVTPALLELLERNRCRATFFLIGNFVRQCAPLTRAIADRGHVIGNHTYTHPNLMALRPRSIQDELERCQAAIAEAAGHTARWMRPPYGFRGPQLAGVLRRMELRGPVMWTVSAHDWVPQAHERLAARLQRVRGGDIVLLHDGDHRRLRGDRDQTLRILAHWLPRWRDEGIEFVTLDDVATNGNESKPAGG